MRLQALLLHCDPCKRTIKDNSVLLYRLRVREGGGFIGWVLGCLRHY
jgi:hypothetical protein